MPGKDGCAYLSPGALTNNLSYVSDLLNGSRSSRTVYIVLLTRRGTLQVMGPLMQNLHEFGYTDSDLVAMPVRLRAVLCLSSLSLLILPSAFHTSTTGDSHLTCWKSEMDSSRS